MLNAIGVYVQDITKEDFKLKKTKFAQQDKSGFLFYSNQLENIDSVLFKSAFPSAMQPKKVYPIESKNEYCYLYFSTKTNAFLAISSKKPLDPIEQRYLFNNIEHIVKTDSKVKLTLEDIIANPLRFTGRDLLIGRINDIVGKEIPAIMLDNIDKVLQRGEKIEDTLDKTDHLVGSSIHLDDGLKRKYKKTCC